MDEVQRNLPLASVIVITYNQERCLAKTLDSILSQKCDFDIEIVIGDDCSKDATRSIMASYSNKYSNVKSYYNEKNLGLVGNYISTLKHCSGKYIAMCDGDDVWIDENKLSKQVAIMESNQEIGLVYTDVEINSVVTGEKFVRRCQDPSDELFTQLLKGNIITISSVCMRASLLELIDFDEFINEGFKMQDYPMWLTLCHYTKFYRIPEVMVSYLIDHPILKSDEVMRHACDFDANTTNIRLLFWERYQDETKLTKTEILDEHYKMEIRAGLQYNDRKHVDNYIGELGTVNVYYKRLHVLCKSVVGFYVYQLYRRITGKRKTPLQLYFGN